MNPSLWVTIGTACLALAGVLFTAVVSWRSQSNQKLIDQKLAAFKIAADKELARLNAELQTDRDVKLATQEGAKVLAKFRDPLLHASYDLQSRIVNILRLGFLERYYRDGSSREQNYAIENTVFLFAQFFAWTEIIRQEIQILALDDNDRTRQLRQLQDVIYGQFQTDRFGPGFRLFGGEQRAVGELMVDAAGRNPRCIGFAAFLTSRNSTIDRWLDPLREDLKIMSMGIDPFRTRLTAVQHSLVDILQFLDPEHIWFSSSNRHKI